jgi:hypothetical protein
MGIQDRTTFRPTSDRMTSLFRFHGGSHAVPHLPCAGNGKLIGDRLQISCSPSRARETIRLPSRYRVGLVSKSGTH